MAKISPTQRTLKLLREQGDIAEVVERFNLFSNTRKDLFGFGDIVRLNVKTRKISLLQVTGGGNFASRKNKITQLRREAALAWLRCGGEIEIWDWRKVLKKRGGKQKVYKARIEKLGFIDFQTPSILS